MINDKLVDRLLAFYPRRQHDHSRLSRYV